MIKEGKMHDKSGDEGEERKKGEEKERKEHARGRANNMDKREEGEKSSCIYVGHRTYNHMYISPYLSSIL